MNTPKSNDEVMQELNDLAKAQGRYLSQAFWEIPREPGSIFDVPLTSEAEERIRRLDATIARLKRQRDASRNVEGKHNAPSKLPDPAAGLPSSAPTDMPPAKQPSAEHDPLVSQEQ